MDNSRPYYGSKVCVIIPCKNRNRNLGKHLKKWFNQTYKNVQVVIVDYDSSSSLYRIVKQSLPADKTLAYNEPRSNADCLILRLENMPYFNMSHAINYAIQRTSGEVISIAGVECSPEPYYLDIAMLCIDNETFTRCIRGRLTLPRHFVDKINGYPEMMEYWGGEDDVVVYQLCENGYRYMDIDYALADNMQNAYFSKPIRGYSNQQAGFHRHFEGESLKYRRKDFDSKYEGCLMNLRIMNYYLKNRNDLLNNYGGEWGSEEAVLMNDPEEKIPMEYGFGLWNKIHPKSRLINTRVAVVLTPLRYSLENWVCQYYENKQIVLERTRDNEQVLEIAKKYKLSVCDVEQDGYDYNADIVFSSKDYARSFIESDVVVSCPGGSRPEPYFLDIVMNMVEEGLLIRSGDVLSATYEDWAKNLSMAYQVIPEKFSRRHEE